MTGSKSSSVSARQLCEIQDKINSSAEEQSAFVKNPKKYLSKSGIKLPKEFQADLEQNLAEMSIAPESFRELSAMNNKAAGVMISIRIPF